MSTRLLRTWIGCAVVALMSGCGAPVPEAPPVPSGKGLPTIEVRAAGAAAERLYEGRVEGVDQTTVRAQTSGRVGTIVHDVNENVSDGTVVLKLRGIEQRAGLAQAQSGLAEAVAREAEVRQRYQRIADLYERKVVARAAYDSVVAERDAAAARVAAARAGAESARESVAYADVAAPFSGIVAARHVQPGDVITPGQPLFDIVAPGRLRVVLDVPQAVADSQRAAATAAVLRGGERVAAAAMRVFASASTESGTVRIWIDLPSDAVGFYAGQFVRVALPGSGPATLLVPAASLVERGEVTAVYVVAPDGALSLRQVRVGNRDAATVQVLAGLSAGERVVTDPLAAMRAVDGKVAR